MLDQKKIDQLASFSEPSWDKEWINYRELNFNENDIDGLIEVILNADLFWNEDDNDTNIWTVPVHAWRAIGQLKATKAIEPIISCFDEYYNSDWAMEEFPVVMAMIGKEAIDPLKQNLFSNKTSENAKIESVFCLTEIAKHKHQNNEIFDSVIGILASYLANPDKDRPDLNGSVVSFLYDLHKVRPVSLGIIELIRKLYKDGLVDLIHMGDIEDVEIYFGVREKRDTIKQRSRLSKEFQNIMSNLPLKSYKIGRNDPCHCDSGKKYKKCCLLTAE